MVNRKIDAATATEQLYALYKHDVYRYARYTTGDTGLSEDVVQEVFVRVLRNWDKFRGDAGVKTWLWKIVRSCIVDMARKQSRQPDSSPFDETIRSHGSQSGNALFEMEDMLKQLSAAYRDVVVLRLIEDWSTHETATILGWSESKVKTTLHRAVQQLRSMMDEGGNVNGVPRSARTVPGIE